MGHKKTNLVSVWKVKKTNFADIKRTTELTGCAEEEIVEEIWEGCNRHQNIIPRKNRF